MILVVNETNSGDLEQARVLFESRGHRTCTLSTSSGNVCTVLDVTESEYSALGDFVNAVPFSPSEPYFLAGRQIKDTDTVVPVGFGRVIGGPGISVIAGPCSIESEEQMLESARIVRESGATVLRGGAFKPRTSPYAFQGMGVEGLKILRKAGDLYGLPVITEIIDAEDIPLLEEYADILQVGARNCQNFSLLKKLGKSGKPVMLKRGMMTNMEEFLSAAEYILSGGNMNVILCERGIRTFENETRNTLDISAVPLLKQKSHLPVIVDPSHASGSWRLIEPLSRAAIAAGADGLMIEMHPDPSAALCDGKQSLRPERFSTLMKTLQPLGELIHREVCAGAGERTYAL